MTTFYTGSGKTITVKSSSDERPTMGNNSSKILVSPINTTTLTITKELKNLLGSKNFSNIQIAAILSHWFSESNFNTQAVGDSGKSLGIALWYDIHKDDLTSYAKDSDENIYSMGTQIDFFEYDLNNTQRNIGYLFKSAITIEDACWSMNSYQKFKGYQDPNGAQTLLRLRNAKTFLTLF